MGLSEIRLEDLDINDLKKIGSAPLSIKVIIVVVLCAGLAAAGYFLDTTSQKAELEAAIAKERELPRFLPASRPRPLTWKHTNSSSKKCASRLAPC